MARGHIDPLCFHRAVSVWLALSPSLLRPNLFPGVPSHLQSSFLDKLPGYKRCESRAWLVSSFTLGSLFHMSRGPRSRLQSVDLVGR